MDTLFHHVSCETSRMITSTYSTSFSVGCRFLHPCIRDAIYSIYGFVRVADEIVDTFHEYDQEMLLKEFEHEYYRALKRGISTNPVLNAFQHTVKKYDIPDELIQAFLDSMKSDLYKNTFGEEEIKEYIYGSSEAVGLMCLKVFVRGDNRKYNLLKPYAMRLGAAFQKINFLRDLKHDTHHLHRVYFPMLKEEPLNEFNKKQILQDIYEDYQVALEGIKQLPECARLGVYTAYLYYQSLTKRIELTPAEELMGTRIRIFNRKKMLLLGKAYFTTKFN